MAYIKLKILKVFNSTSNQIQKCVDIFHGRNFRNVYALLLDTEKFLHIFLSDQAMLAYCLIDEFTRALNSRFCVKILSHITKISYCNIHAWEYLHDSCKERIVYFINFLDLSSIYVQIIFFWKNNYYLFRSKHISLLAVVFLPFSLP